MNNLTIVGRLGADPEFRMTQGGDGVCKLRVAVNRRKKDAPADWFNVEVWGKQAETCANLLKKGSEVAVSGSMENHQYEKDGLRRDAWKLRANDVRFLGSKKGEGSAAPPPDFDDEYRF